MTVRRILTRALLVCLVGTAVLCVFKFSARGSLQVVVHPRRAGNPAGVQRKKRIRRWTGKWKWRRNSLLIWPRRS
jgi:hypothetical protein